MSNNKINQQRLGEWGLKNLRFKDFGIAAKATPPPSVRNATNSSEDMQDSHVSAPIDNQDKSPKDCFLTNTEDLQYKAGLRSEDDSILSLLSLDKMQYSHFYQGLLCAVAARNDIEFFIDLLENQDGQYPKLSVTYNDGAVLYYAVINKDENQASKVIEYLLTAGIIDPHSILKERIHETVYPLHQNRLNSFARNLMRSENVILSRDIEKWAPPSKNI